MVLRITLVLALAVVLGTAWAWPTAAVKARPTTDATVARVPDRVETAVFAAGCFWHVESTFRQVPGVVATAAGFSGGITSWPTYKEVCGRGTGHVEVVRVTFDPSQVSYDQLLDAFWACHNPTVADDPPRSVIFYASESQRAVAEASKARRQGATVGKTIATAIKPAGVFWRAEEYHQQYAEKNGGSCRMQ